MMKEEVFERLGIGFATAEIGVDWEESEKTFPGRPAFLEPEFIRATVQEYLQDWTPAGNNEPLSEMLIASAERITRNRDALRLLWHQHYLVTQNYERYWLKCYKFPELPVLGEDARPYFCCWPFLERTSTAIFMPGLEFLFPPWMLFSKTSRRVLKDRSSAAGKSESHLIIQGGGKGSSMESSTGWDD